MPSHLRPCRGFHLWTLSAHHVRPLCSSTNKKTMDDCQLVSFLSSLRIPKVFMFLQGVASIVIKLTWMLDQP